MMVAGGSIGLIGYATKNKRLIDAGNVIGGIGSIRGAFIAALLVGLVDTLGRIFGPFLLRMIMDGSAASQTGRALAPMLIYILMAAVLFFRPAGLFPVRK
jgi:branched-chain amino acid transport system permease protein